MRAASTARRSARVVQLAPADPWKRYASSRAGGTRVRDEAPGRRAPLTDAMSRRTEFDPTSMTARARAGLSGWVGRGTRHACRERPRATLERTAASPSRDASAASPACGRCSRPLARRRENPRICVVGEGTVEDRVDLRTRAGVPIGTSTRCGDRGCAASDRAPDVTSRRARLLRMSTRGCARKRPTIDRTWVRTRLDARRRAQVERAMMCDTGAGTRCSYSPRRSSDRRDG